jgi:TolB protein
MSLIVRRPLLPPMTRRAALTGMGATAAAGLLLPRGALAQTRLDVTQGNVKPIDIAIPQFVAGSPSDGETAAGVTQVITNNLKRSGLFNPLDPAAYLERITNIDVPAAISELAHHQCAGADYRSRHAAGRRTAQGGIPAVGRAGGPAAHRPAIRHARKTWRRIAHIISDQIYER